MTCGVHYFSSRPGIPFFEKFSLKTQNCQLKLKLITMTYLNMHNSMVVFTLAVLDGNTIFGQIARIN